MEDDANGRGSPRVCAEIGVAGDESANKFEPTIGN